jgi:hypothetical protein
MRKMVQGKRHLPDETRLLLGKAPFLQGCGARPGESTFSRVIGTIIGQKRDSEGDGPAMAASGLATRVPPQAG